MRLGAIGQRFGGQGNAVLAQTANPLELVSCQRVGVGSTIFLHECRHVVMKLHWDGEIVSIQPRIRLTRSFDQRSHAYLGYALSLHGSIGGEARAFSVGIGKAAQAKLAFRVGDIAGPTSKRCSAYATSMRQRLDFAPPAERLRR
jgi:hypothetical protein